MRGQHPGPDRGALAAMRHGHDPERGAGDVAALGRLRPCRDDGGRGVGAAVVHDHDVDAGRQPGRSRRPVPGTLAATPQVAEQLVQRRADPVGLVVRREHDGERFGGWHAGAVYWSVAFGRVRRWSLASADVRVTSGPPSAASRVESW